MKHSTLGFGVAGVAIIVMSLGPWCGGCSEKGQGKQNGKEMPMGTPQYEGGDLFANNKLSLWFAGPFGKPFRDGDVWLRHFAVKDATGSELPWESTFSDGKTGKAVGIEINAEGATGPVHANGSLTCKGLRYSIVAEWREQKGGPPGDWELVQCKIVRAEAD